MEGFRIGMPPVAIKSNLNFALEATERTSDEVYVMPTSVAQQRFWILDQLEPGNPSLNMPLALKLGGRLNVNALKQSLNAVVSRHEVLRTTFSKDSGELVQVISAEGFVDLNVVDLSTHPDPETEADRLTRDEAHQSFDLERGPLFTAKLICLSPQEHRLLLTLHHIVCDGWSNGVLIREIGEIYDAFSQGLPSPYCELPIQYADFAAWQQEWLNNSEFNEQLAYWKDRLGRDLPVLEVPTDFPRNGKRVSQGAIESLLLPQPLTRAIKTLGRREDATPFMIFLSAFKVLLHKYSGQEDILVGSPTANRTQSETEGLIGAFANTLLLKSDLSGSPTFKELLRRIKDVSLGGFSNQNLPFEKLIEVVRPATNGQRRGQLFQVLFIFQNAFMKPIELKSLTITPLRSVSPGSIFELSLGVVERGEGVRLQLEYNTDLFKVDTARLMLQDLQTILQSAILDPNRKISELLPWTTPLRSRAEDKNGSSSSIPSLPDTKASSSVEKDAHIEEILTNIWKDVLHLDSIGPNSDFFEVGGHSLLAAQLFDDIRKRLDVDLPLATLFNAATIAQLAELIRQKRPTHDVWTSLVPINPNGTKPPFFLMHAAGGNVLFYKDLSNRLGEQQPCYGMQAVGLGGHQSAYDRIEDMAAHYIKEIRGVQPKGPYYLGGASVGGLIAFEAASQLKAIGEEVEFVILFDTAAPGYPKLIHKHSRLARTYYNITDRFLQHIEALWISENGKRWEYITAKATKAKNRSRRIYKQTKKSLMRGIAIRSNALPDALNVTRSAIASAARTYSPAPYDGDVILFRATKQHRGIEKDDTLGWSRFVVGDLKIHEIRGDHGTIVVEPRVRFSAAILKEYLDHRGTPQNDTPIALGTRSIDGQEY